MMIGVRLVVRRKETGSIVVLVGWIVVHVRDWRRAPGVASVVGLLSFGLGLVVASFAREENLFGGERCDEIRGS